MVHRAQSDAREEEVTSLRIEMELQYQKLEEVRRQAEDWQDRYHETLATKERLETDLLATRREVQMLMTQRPDERTESFQMRRKNRAYAELERVNNELGIDGKPIGDKDSWLNNTNPRLTRAMQAAQAGTLRQTLAPQVTRDSEALTSSRGRAGGASSTAQSFVSRTVRTGTAPKSLLAQALEATARESYMPPGQRQDEPRLSAWDRPGVASAGLSHSFSVSRPKIHGSVQGLLSASQSSLYRS